MNVLTQKNQIFCWTEDCHEAFTTLKWHLTSTLVLAYPILESNFVLETGASICELGAVLSQAGEDELSHLVAYASYSLTDAERNYSVTELKTLAVMWAMSHFRSYLYGQKLTILMESPF